MPQLDPSTFLPQVFWLIVTFTTLFLVMWRVALPRIADVLEARQERMEDNLEKAEGFKMEAEAALEAYEAAMVEARNQANDVIAQARNALNDQVTKRQDELSETIAERIKEGEAAIDKAKQEALGTLQGMSAELTTAALEKLTGEAPNEASVAAAVDNALKARRG